jgi:hypothetical protein
LKQEKRAPLVFNQEALAFYGRLFDFKLRGKSGTSAFIDLGDQFLARRKAELNLLTKDVILDLWSMTRMPSARRWPSRGSNRYSGRSWDFLDPWGNRIEIVGYDNVQFTKAPNVLRGMGLTHLSKNEQALKELTAKDMAPN